MSPFPPRKCAIALAIIMTASGIPFGAHPASAQPFQKDDIAVMSVQLQAMQVVWQNDSDWGDPIMVDALTSRSNIDLVKGKASLAFGTLEDADTNPYTINLDGVVNWFTTEKLVKVELRLFAPNGSDRRIFLTQQSWSLPAAAPGDPANIPAGQTSLNFTVPVSPAEVFRPDQVGWYWLEARVVNPDGTVIGDADPSNQKGGHSFHVRDTHGLKVLFKPAVFTGSTHPAGTFTGIGGPAAAYLAAATLVPAVYPVAEQEFLGMYDTTPFRFNITRNWFHFLPWLDSASAENLSQWENLTKHSKQLSYAAIVQNVAGQSWAAGYDRVVLLDEPGFLEADDGARGLSYTSVNKHVVFTSWGSVHPGSTTAHEIGHTYGLWLDGQEEYDNSVPGNNGGEGRDANGFWVTMGRSRNGLYCFMGSGSRTDGQTWVDKPDYRRLLDRFSAQRDPEILGVRALLAENESVLMAPWHHYLQGDLDLNGSENGTHGIILKNAAGQQLGTYRFDACFTIQVDPLAPERVDVIPVNFRIPWLSGTSRVELWNLSGNRLLAARNVSSAPPVTAFSGPLGGEVLPAASVDVRWTGSDADGDSLSYILLASNDSGANWTPLAGDTNRTEFQWNASDLPDGSAYRLRLVATDGVNTAFAETGDFTVTHSYFAMGMEPRSAAVVPGGMAPFNISISSSGGYDGTVLLNATTDAPSGTLQFTFPGGATAAPPANGTATTVIQVRANGSAAPGNWSVTVTGTGGGRRANVTAALSVLPSPPRPVIALSATETSTIAGPGDTTPFNLTIMGWNLSAPIRLRASTTLPGATVAWPEGDTVPQTNGTAFLRRLNVTVPVSAAPGSYSATVTGETSGALGTLDLTLEVVPPPSITELNLSISPSRLELGPGGNGTVSVTLSAGPRYSGPGELRAEVAPQSPLNTRWDGTANFTLSPDSAILRILAVDVDGSAGAGEHCITVVASAAGQEAHRTLTVNITPKVAPPVEPPGPGNVTVRPGTAPALLKAGKGVNWTFTLEPVDGFAGNVTVRAFPAPAHPGIKMVPSAGAVSLPGTGPNGTAILMVEVQAGLTARAGNYNITVQLSWSGGSWEKTAVLKVEGPKPVAPPKKFIPAAPAGALILGIAVLVILNGRRRRGRELGFNINEKWGPL